MSDDVERRVYQLLGRPTRSPYGNPIPGLAELDASVAAESRSGPAEDERHLATPGLSGPVVVSRICESVQTDPEMLRQMHAAGVDPGAKVTVTQEPGTVVVDCAGSQVRLPHTVASRVFVTAA